MADLPYRNVDDRAVTQAQFRGRPDAWRLFRQLATTLEGWGDVRIVAQGGKAGFEASSRFAWVSRASRDGSLTLRWLTPERLESLRLRTEVVGDRWSHTARVGSLDAELLTWLREAYEWDAKPADAIVRLRFRKQGETAVPVGL